MIGLAFLLALAPSERDAMTLARYLDERRIREVVEAAGIEGWQRCVDDGSPLSAQGLPVTLTIAPDGKVSDASAGDDPCLDAATRALVFPAHDEDEVTVHFLLASANGRVVAPMSIELDQRTIEPLLVHVPPHINDADRHALLVALGLEPEPEPDPPPAVEP